MVLQAAIGVPQGIGQRSVIVCRMGECEAQLGLGVTADTVKGCVIDAADCRTVIAFRFIWLFNGLLGEAFRYCPKMQ